jgi:hypothetical protein
MANDPHFICCCTEQFNKNLAEWKFYETTADEEEKKN